MFLVILNIQQAHRDACH